MIVEPIPVPQAGTVAEGLAAYRVHVRGMRTGGVWDATSDEFEPAGADLCSAHAWALEHAWANNSAFTLRPMPSTAWSGRPGVTFTRDSP
ncbi:hypothetical protein [Spirillospora albida]|uniref:hypothetical protein n=1 Tax=Spirillospora albida TaxID=58123 RepID=UPI0004C22D5B|nr:hypothetical protein [Spirillospora albida]